MYSIIIPCYKSSETISTVVETTAAEMDRMGRHEYEFVLVNDCSPDGGATIRELRSLAERYSFVKVVDLARNCGQHSATAAGMREGSGDVFISMDDDMQTRPSELPKMFKAFDEGYDVVYGAYPVKKENPFRLFGSWVNKMCAVLFLNKPKDLRSSSFWIMRKYVRDSVIAYNGPHTYLLGLILRATSNITHVEVQHFERTSGKSGYTFKALLSLWSNIIGFTVKPLRLAMSSGMIIAFFSVVFALVTLIRKLVNPSLEAGWASVIIGIFFSLGVILFFLGLIGEYVGRMYMQISGEPQYVVRARYNFENDPHKVSVSAASGSSESE